MAKRRAIISTLPAVMLLAALVLLRWQAVSDLELSLGEALDAGLLRGMIFDAGAVLLPSVVAWFLYAVASLAPAWPWIAVSALVWGISLANTLYFRFFGSVLEWWIVRLHWQDLAVVKSAAAKLSFSLWIVASLVALASAAVLAAYWRREIPPRFSRASWRGRGMRLGRALAMLAISIVLVQARGLFSAPNPLAIINNSVLNSLWGEARGSGRANRHAELFAHQVGLDISVQNPGAVLATYRDSGRRHGAGKAVNSQWPLYVSLETSAEESRTLRQELGLPLEGKINVWVLFLESVRAYEIDHPELGPAIFPNLRRVLSMRAVSFGQAYSSVAGAGLTVRGQFSSLCSALPDMTGPATYLARVGLRAVCIQQLFAEHGYQTLWLNAYRQNYHNKSSFESLHGTQRFIDRQHFGKLEDTEHIGSWPALSDAPFLLEALRLLERANEEGPFFAHALTMSSHFPFSLVDSVAIPDAARRFAGDDADYLAYLSTLRYVDESLGALFDAFFDSPLADNTVIALLADHSLGLAPPIELGPRERTEVFFRIPFALITRDMPIPERREYPVHQADLAPTLAHLAGMGGDVTWIGRNCLTEPGSPWVVWHQSSLSYRQGQRACYTSHAGAPLQCYLLGPGQDPMFAATTAGATPDPEQTAHYERVVAANGLLILNNAMTPTDFVVRRAGR